MSNWEGNLKLRFEAQGGKHKRYDWLCLTGEAVSAIQQSVSTTSE